MWHGQAERAKLNQLVEVARRAEIALPGSPTCLAVAHPHREEIEPCYRKPIATSGRRQASAKLVTLEVDGREVTVPEGTSVMRAAALADVAIPKLCATDSLEPFGSCRLCLVEVEGRNGYPASCTTPVESGMKVRTKSESSSGCGAA